MLNQGTLLADLEALGLASWEKTILPIVNERLADSAHGNLAGWKAVLDKLPAGNPCPQDIGSLRALLMQLIPWRKGPFQVHGFTIDAEWQSDLKWARLIDHIEPLAGRRVLDVGAGNGWYCLQMRKAGAEIVIGIDPTVLFVVQFEAIRKICDSRHTHVLPLKLEDLPKETHAFDTTFSMRVLYHRRDPLAHLAELRETLRAGGELVLETLVFPGDDLRVHEPEDRYARMRNVWHLPTIPALQGWLRDAGFERLRVIDVSTTTPAEQRRTEWMPFESLAQALDADNPDLTVEGLPAPTRAILSCRAP